MTEIKFTILQCPTGKKAPHHTRSGITYSSKEQKYNENALITEMLPYRPSEPITDPIELNVDLYFPVPNSKPAWWRNAALGTHIHYDKKPDYDNCLKNLCDCLEKLQFIKNDSQIFFSVVSKAYSDKPRWEVRIVIRPNTTRKEWEKI